MSISMSIAVGIVYCMCVLYNLNILRNNIFEVEKCEIKFSRIHKQFHML